MTNAILEREFDVPLTRQAFSEILLRSAGCFGLHHVEWHYSMCASGGRRLVCWFQSPDLESVRIALRTADNDVSDVWPGVETRVDLWSGTIYDAPDLEENAVRSANVLVERRFDEPVTLDEIQAIEDTGANCLDVRDVRFVRTFFSTDHRRMLCVYSAPDAESVRQAQREAGMPVENVWSFERLENTTDDKTLV